MSEDDVVSVSVSIGRCCCDIPPGWFVYIVFFLLFPPSVIVVSASAATWDGEDARDWLAMVVMGKNGGESLPRLISTEWVLMTSV